MPNPRPAQRVDSPDPLIHPIARPDRQPRHWPHRSPAIARLAPIIVVLAALVLAVGPGHAQQQGGGNAQNPIYLADSPTAQQSLLRLPELIEQQNLDEAVRLTDQVITELGDRLIAQNPDDPDRVHIPVRRRLERFVLDHRALLDAYRLRQTPAASAWLAQGDWARVARDAWLTEPGFIASVRWAQTLIEAAQFNAGMALLADLESHPDADAQSAMAASLAHLGARYLDTEQAWALAERWRARAGLAPSPRDPIEPPPSAQAALPAARSLIWSTAQHTEPVSLAGIVPGELARAPLTPEVQLDLIDPDAPGRFGSSNWEPTPWVAPVALGSALYTNDGVTISCFDRFTLRPIWRVQTSTDTSQLPVTPDTRARLGRIIEDQTTLTIDDGALYSAGGIPKNGARDGDPRLYKLDADDGQIRWGVDITALDPTLVDASIRGPVIVDHGSVLVMARTNNRRQRLISLTVVALDAATGDLRWIRPVASAGSLPFQQMGQLAHAPIVSDGIAYYTDHIGVAFAIRTATGSVLWARPLPAPDLYARFSRPSFAGNTPVLNSHGLFVLTTDATRIIRLDPATGHTLDSRPADPLGESMYLLQIDDDRFAAVSTNRVTLYRADRFATASPVRSPELGTQSNIRGRVVSAGGRLIVPISTGVALLDPNNPAKPQSIALDHTGNILALDGQLIVVDEMDAMSFLAWDTASAMLSARIQEDPGASVTLAELAFRAGRQGEIIPSVQRAMRVLRTLPIDQRRRLEDQLFGVVLTMVTPSRPGAGAPDAPDTTTATDATNATGMVTTPLDPASTLTLLNHLGELARTHEQVVAHRMALGALHQRRSDPAGAVRAYQDILDQPALSAAMWEGTGIAVRAGLEATRRIGGIIESVGYAPYTPLDRLADTERGFIEPGADPAAYERLATRYPWASIAPSLWRSASEGYSSAHRVPAAISAATRGIDAARRLSHFSIDTDPAVVNDLAETALSGMIATNRARDAEIFARGLAGDFPDLTLRVGGRVVTGDQLADAAHGANQMPALGNSFIRDDAPLLVTGSPVKTANRIDPGGIVLYAPQLGRVQYVRMGPNITEPVWERRSPTNEPPLIPWQDQTRTLIFWPQGNDANTSATLEAIETTTGRLVWSIGSVRARLWAGSTRVADDMARVDSMIPVPVNGPAPIGQLLVSTDGRTVVITDRIGRAMGLDLFSGDELWHTDLPLNRVHDLDLSGSILGVCGLMVTDRAVHQRAGTAVPIVAALDPRTGEPIQVLDRFGMSPRWVRTTADGHLLVATTDRVIAINTAAGSVDWSLQDGQLVETVGAWVSADQLITLDASATLWSINLDDGRRSPRPLDTRGRISSRGWIDVRPGIDRTLLASSKGLVAFDGQQQVIATDPLDLSGSIVDIAWGRDRAVLVEQARFVDGAMQARLHLIGLEDQRLLDTITLSIPATLDRTPVSATAVATGVLVGFGEVSVFVRTSTDSR